jgi:hypothetical protein
MIVQNSSNRGNSIDEGKNRKVGKDKKRKESLVRDASTVGYGGCGVGEEPPKIMGKSVTRNSSDCTKPPTKIMDKIKRYKTNKN